MAIGWLSVLRMVPWAEVISNAPKVAEGAKKLWNAVNKKSPSPDLVDEEADVPADAGLDTLATLQARLATMEIATADLHSQMLASSELIKVLADQNAQLIKRMEVHRIRIVWLAGATVVFGIIAVIGLILAAAP